MRSHTPHTHAHNHTHIFIVKYYYFFYSLRVIFTSVLADGLSLEFEWQQVSLSLQDYSQYSGRSQYYIRLDGLHSSFYF